MADSLPEDTLPADPRGQIGDPTFPVAFRGYDRAAVDAYVERVRRIVGELQTTSSPREAVRHALEDVGTETTDILRQAHEAAETVTNKAQTGAAEMTARAEADAAATYAAAEQRVVDLDRDADVLWQERRKLIEDVRRTGEELAALAAAAEGRFPPEAEPVPEAESVRDAEPVPEPELELETEPDATVEIPAADLPDAEEPPTAERPA
jgi:DivIVA domain-containing protein